VVVVCREPSAVASKVKTILIEGRSRLGVPSGRQNPSSTSKELGASTARNSQYPRDTSPSGPVIAYADRPPGYMSWRANVAG